jgi:hypothetical protein
MESSIILPPERNTMTTFEKYRKRSRERFIASWPKEQQAALKELLLEADSTNEMPDAELTPELVALRKMEREAIKNGFEVLKQKGAVLLELRRRMRPEEFWNFVENRTGSTREDAELAIEAASE